MKKIFTLLFLFACLSLRAQSIITATVTVTNNPVFGNSITVNGQTRAWTNSVTNFAGQLLIGANITASTSNAFVSYAISVNAGVTPSTNGTTNILFLKGNPGVAMSVTFDSTNWATVTYSTNTLTDVTFMRAPITAVGSYEQSNVASAIVAYLSTANGVGNIPGTSIYLVNFGSLTNTNTWLGSNVFSKLSGTLGNISNGVWTSGTAVTLTNQFLQDPTSATSWGVLYPVGGGAMMAWRKSGFGSQQDFTLYDSNLVARFLWNIAGTQFNDASGNPQGAFTTNAQQLYGFNLTFPNTTNQTSIGAMTFGAGDVRYPQLAGINALSGTNTYGGVSLFNPVSISSLANGYNADIPTSTNTFLRLSGPTANFTNVGFTAGVDGRIIIVQNKSTFPMAFLNDSGLESTAANRIYTGTGGTVTVTNNPGSAALIYDGGSSHWVLTQQTP